MGVRRMSKKYLILKQDIIGNCRTKKEALRILRIFKKQIPKDSKDYHKYWMEETND